MPDVHPPEPPVLQTVAQILDRERWATDDRSALHAAGRTWSYADLARDLSDAIARITGATTPGDAVAVLAVDDGPTLVALCAVVATGRVAVPVDPRDPTGRAERAIGLTGPTLLLRAGDLPPGAPDLAWRALADLPPVGPAEAQPVDADAPAVVFFTSGTTGVPRGCLRTHAQIALVVADNADLQELQPDRHYAFTFPLAFQGGLTCALAGFLRGATVTLLDTTALGVDGLTDALSDPGLTNIGAVPSILRRVARRCTESGRTLDRVVIVGVGGEPVDDTDVTLVRAAMPGATFRNFYGTQESGTIAASRIPPDAVVAPGPLPAGTARPGLTVVVVDEEGNPLPVGETGEVASSGAIVSTDYLGDAEGAAARRVSIDDVVGMRTGDLGRFGPGGVLHIVGRTTHRVKVLGAAIDLLEVETALRGLPRVVAAVVSAVDDEQSGRRLVAHVVTTGPGGLTTADLRVGLADRLPTAAHPRRVLTYDAFPHTTREKVDRHTLDALAADPAAPIRDLGDGLVALGPHRPGHPTVLLVGPRGVPLGPLLPLTVDGPGGPAAASLVALRSRPGPGAGRRRRRVVERLGATGSGPVAVLDLAPVPDVAALRAAITAAIAVALRTSSPPDPAGHP